MSNRFQALQKRIDRLRIPQQRLSELTGLDESTLSRAFNGKTDPRISTVDKIETAVETEEAAVAEYLNQKGSGGRPA